MTGIAIRPERSGDGSAVPDPAVREVLEALAPDTRLRVEQLRRIVRKAAPAAVETAVWGCLSYHLPFLGGRVKGAVCQIRARAGRVELGFIHGALLPDPKRLLQGTGKSKRSVRVDTLDKAHAHHLAALVRSASEIRPAR